MAVAVYQLAACVCHFAALTRRMKTAAATGCRESPTCHGCRSSLLNGQIPRHGLTKPCRHSEVDSTNQIQSHCQWRPHNTQPLVGHATHTH